jgi:hypothetical protein
MSQPFIQELIAKRFTVFNVTMDKCPCTRDGKRMKEWERKTFDEMSQQHNFSNPRWGLRMGEHENGRRIMSLDFDIYDKQTDGDCIHTKQLLTEYLAGCSNQYGMYSSSTAGNMNVLVDYTASPTIAQLVENLKSFKFNKYGLEILVKGNQVIPPSQTKCKKTQDMGKPRQFLTDKPFYIITDEDQNDFTFKFIYQLFQSKMKKTKPPTPAPTPTQQTITSNTSTIAVNSEDKFLDLLFNVIKNERNFSTGAKVISHAQWFQIAGILKLNNYPFQVFEDYTNSMPNKQRTDTAEKRWRGINTSKSMSIYGLQNIAKQVNPQGYKSWLVQHNAFLNLAILNKGENDIAAYIAPYLIKTMVYCNKEWFTFNTVTSLWCNTEDPNAKITTFIQRKIDEAKECLLHKLNSIDDDAEYKKLKALEKDYDTHYTNVAKCGCSSQIFKYLKSYLSDPEFISKLDNGLYKMVYRNGILDLKTMQFQFGIQQDDYMTKTIPFDYQVPTADDKAAVREILKKICNYDESHLNYYLSALGYAFTGDSSREQNFWYLRGQTASNGKSVIFETLEKLAPNYVTKANSDILDKGADLRKEVPTWAGCKILWLNEVSTKRKDEDIVKSICDGTSLKYNKLYSINAIVMPIQFKLFAVSNNTLVIKGDAGIQRRFRLMQYNSQFQDNYVDDVEKLQFKKDKDLGNKLCGEYKHALFQLIAEYGHKYFNEKQLCEYQIEWNREAVDTMDDNNEFSSWFYDQFTIEMGALTYKNDFELAIEQSKFKHFKKSMIKDELTRMKVPYEYKSQHQATINSKKLKGFWVGFKLVADDTTTAN